MVHMDGVPGRRDIAMSGFFTTVNREHCRSGIDHRASSSNRCMLGIPIVRVRDPKLDRCEQAEAEDHQQRERAVDG